MAQEDKNLRSFMSTVEELYQPVPGGRPTENGFDRDFQKLKNLSSDLKKKEEHKGPIGQKPENKKKNRYKDIIPFDETRVQLTVTNNDPFSGYINASFIKGAEGHRNYIASQGPLPHTVLDFWQMLWQYNVACIVMVCREIELGKKKCERYWADEDGPKNFGGVTVTLNKKEELEDGYCLRTIKAQKGEETRIIKQFHYTSWPDHGVPKTCFEIISLINHVRDIQSYSQDETTPLCVHCSAGCGRTGAVLAVDFVRNLLATKTVPSGLKMFDVIAEMRKQRPALVQTKDQYEFVNAAIVEMFSIYMQTRTISYREFSVGYQGEQYVNVNIGSEDRSKAKRNGVGPPQSVQNIPSYENVDIKTRPKPNSDLSGKGTAKPTSLEDYPDDPPPAKPHRPISVIGPESSSLTSHNNVSRRNNVPPTALVPPKADRKQSAPAVLTQKKGPPMPATKPRNLNISSRVVPPTHSRSASSPTGKGEKPAAAGRLKPNKPEPSPKNFSTATGLKSTGAKPKAVEGLKKKVPIKPQRSFRIKPTEGSANSTSPSAATTNKTPAAKSFQKYQKRNVYNDISIKDEENNPRVIVESAYELLPDTVPLSTNSTLNAERSTNGASSPGPPKLPERTAESQILLGDAPPQLPTRTPDSYLPFDDTDSSQQYEAVGSSTATLPHPSAQSFHAEVGRRHSGASSPGTNFLASKAKNMLEKTTNAFSKVSSSISKNADEDPGATTTTVENRTPAYVQSPVVYSGQDMSFGKRLMKKVRGGRKLK